MIKSKLIKYSFVCIFLITIIFMSVIIKVSAQTPIIDISEERDTFTPSSMADNWDYYIVNPGSVFPDIVYQGLPTTMQYSSELSNTFETLTTDRDPGESLLNHLKSSDSRNSKHPFFDDEELPRAVRTSTDDEASYSAKQLMTISLHMNYQFTFLAEDNIEYLVLINSSDPFYLDVDIKDDSAAGELNFETSIFPYPGFPLTGVWKETIPVFPVEERTLRFTFKVDSPTIVALTPHKMGSSSSITIPANNTFGAEIVQDIPSPLPTDQEITAEDLNKKIGFSLRQFSLPMVEGEYYRIYLFMNDLDPSTNQSIPFLLGENYHIISGTLNTDGLLVRATADTKLTLVLYSKGYTNQEYTIYFRNVVATSDTAELELNVNTTLESGTRYFFTLNLPSMMAINYTGPICRFDLLAESGIPEFPWIEVADQGDFYLKDGNLYDPGLTGIDWIYVPAGNYALDPKTPLSDVIMFHTVEVQELSPSLSLSMNQNSVIAFEIPESSLQFNQINRVNMSTSDHKNESITYQYSVVAKYNELIDESVPSVAMGNEETSPGSWTAWDENNTEILEFLPSRPKETPVVVIRPLSAENQSGSISTFSANLAISLSQPTNYYPLDTDIMTRDYLGTGVILPKSSVVSGTSEFTINDDLTASVDQILGIPLSMNQYQLYNITLYLEGNYTSAGDLNASFEGININGGNLGHIMVFESETSGSSATNSWINLLVLAISPTSYLYVDIIRNDVAQPGTEWGNCTLIVDIAGLTVDPMTYNLTDEQNWNPDRLDGETRNTDYLFEEIKPSEFPSGGIDLSFILLVGVVFAGAAGGAGAFYYFRTRRG
ncbi:hypothetical protein CEE45_15285 [Candidatus Heimdallarchaeota archaeon B3_Heim]|nr:MAG: hypothetical protein CEE45_15285 [Candidatus Heimdallarchaeota archaeon B3_Heim]